MADNISERVRVATGFSLALATAAVLLRLLARYVKRISLQPDDYLIICALVTEWGLGIAGVILLANGLGQHIENVPLSHLTVYGKVLYTGAILYAFTICAIKLSILWLYRRVFPTKTMLIACAAVATLVVIWATATVVVGLFICTPIRKIWDPQTPGACLNLVQFYYGIQIPNIITDVVVLVLPIPVILKLPLDKVQKISLCVIFGLGAIVVIFDVIRLVVIIQLTHSNGDSTWNQTNTSVWTCIEPAIAITTASLAHLRPLIPWAKEHWSTLHEKGLLKPTSKATSDGNVATLGSVVTASTAETEKTRYDSAEIARGHEVV